MEAEKEIKKEDEKKEIKEQSPGSESARCCYVDPCGCYADPCGCYVSTCCC